MFTIKCADEAPPQAAVKCAHCFYEEYFEWCAAICAGTEKYDENKEVQFKKKRFKCPEHKQLWRMWQRVGLQTPLCSDSEFFKGAITEISVEEQSPK